MYHNEKPQKRDKFDYAIAGIYACAIIVSFNHTIELYDSGGFDIEIKLLNSLMQEWFGIKGFFTLSLFATLAAESAFTVGLWGLYEAFKVERKLPGMKYKWMWGMFLGGLVIIGWSNIGGTLGYNYLFGNPVKGLVLGLSVPYFVLNAVLVNFSRSQPNEVKETTEQPTDSPPKWKTWINTYKEIKEELATTKSSYAQEIMLEDETESYHPIEQEQTSNDKPNSEQIKTEQKEQEKIEQNLSEKSITEQGQIKQIEHAENEQNLIEQSNIERVESEQSEQEKVEQNLIEQTASDQTKNEQSKQEKSEQTERESGEENEEKNNLEPNKETMENERGEQGKIEQENNESSNSEQNENEQNEQPVIEQKSVEQSNIERSDQTEKNEQYETQKSNKKTNKKSNAHLRVVRTNKVKKGKSEQVAQYVLRLMKQNKEFTVRQVAEKIGCSPSTAQKGINKAKMMKQEA